MKNKIVKGRLIDIHRNEIYYACITVEGERILRVEKTDEEHDNWILPGLIDAHIHIESSMLTPAAFAAASVPHGTIGVVADPHEIANVLGIRGVGYMIEDGEKVPMKFWFGAPSCVPATHLETSGEEITAEEIEILLNKKEITHLSEMMNFPGVVNNNIEVLRKLDLAKKKKKPIDGHAPGLSGKDLKKYVEAGITTDHECSTIEEAKEKLNLGMKIIIREGSAARNLEALKELFITDPENLMLCSDDLHPEMLEKRHINKLIGKLISEDYNIFDIIRSATKNPAEHYNLDAGMLRPGDKADFIIVDDPAKMNVIETWIDGKKVYDNGKVMFEYISATAVNNFKCGKISEEEIRIKNEGGNIRVINAFDGELITKETISETGNTELVGSMPEKDILKIVVKDRYNDAIPAVGFIKGFGIKQGAFASSIAHDSHNIIAVGAGDIDIINAVNEIVKLKGGLAVAVDGKIYSLQLNIAGIMSDKQCSFIAPEYEKLSDMVKMLGCKMTAPFMTLSFMALLVIPELKISDKGLFNGIAFQHVPLFV